MGGGVIFTDLFRALSQLGDRRFQSVFWRGILITLLVFVALAMGVFWLIDHFAPESFSLPWIGQVGGLNLFLSWAGVVVMMALSVFLMVPVASAVTGFFLEEVADAVEARYYPGLPPARDVPLLEMLRDSLGLFLLVIVLNLGLFVVYLFTGPLGPVLFWVVNGFLLGREYFQLVALRRVSEEEARILRTRHFGQIWLAGTLMAAPLTVPIVNLFVPVIGAATFTHLYHRLTRDAG
ncbi:MULTISPECIES: EI24 domain-containing protein [unclassified Haematobacter]|uniref:EI24 domain-containing protein n=1 Tax=unclassified Haematobacter TaxID=2640585 RepID=UPI0025BB27BE|nr:MULTISPECIES: EI24 domain-containing protein [unclassified Haematobacter]